MTSLRSLPTEVLEEIYLSIPKSMMHSEMLEALIADEKKRLTLDGFSGEILSYSLSEYKRKLSAMGPISVAEMAYEACVQNDTFDHDSNLAWVDREGRYRINPNDLYKHKFVDSMLSIAEKAQGYNVTMSDRKNILSQIESVCADGSGSVSLGYGDVNLTFNAEKRQIRYALGASEDLSVAQSDFDRLNSSFNQFIDRCKPSGKHSLTNATSLGM